MDEVHNNLQTIADPLKGSVETHHYSDLKEISSNQDVQILSENEFIQKLYYDSIENNKYIIIYVDNDIEITNKILFPYINLLKIINNSPIKIIRFLLNNESKNLYEDNIIINEIYPDLYCEDMFIKNCLCILYFSSIKRSNQLTNLAIKYNKLIINDINIINSYIGPIFESLVSENYNEEFPQLIENNNKINIENIIYNFIKNYDISNKENTMSLSEAADYSTSIPEICYSQVDLLKLEEYLPKKISNKNINIIINKSIKINNNNKISIVTFFKNSENKILNVIQKKCILENLKNNNVNKLIVIGKNLNEELNDINNENIIIINHNNNLSYKDLIEIINNKLINKIVCLLRSDIVLPNQQSLEELDLDFYENPNEICAISRIERLINGMFVKSDKLNKILFSTEQDGWIFKSPLNINLEKLESIYFYDKYSELYFNYFLKIANYNLVNNTNKFKIIRILYENNIENRILIDNNIQNNIQNNIKNNENNIFLLPDNNSFDKISIENLINSLNLENKEIYNLKCELFNKYFKNKIINDMK